MEIKLQIKINVNVPKEEAGIDHVSKFTAEQAESRIKELEKEAQEYRKQTHLNGIL